jgi:hypothetical protein
VVDAESRGLERGLQHVAPRAIALALLGHVCVVAERAVIAPARERAA